MSSKTLVVNAYVTRVVIGRSGMPAGFAVTRDNTNIYIPKKIFDQIKIEEGNWYKFSVHTNARSESCGLVVTGAMATPLSELKELLSSENVSSLEDVFRLIDVVERSYSVTGD